MTSRLPAGLAPALLASILAAAAGPLQPPNDLCSDAIPVGVPSATKGTTLGASPDPDAPACGGSPTAPGVWYEVLGTGTVLTASLCNAADYDTRLGIYCPVCDAPACVAGNDDDPGAGCGVTSQVSWCAQAGGSYQVLVHGADAQAGGFTLSLLDSGLSCTPGVECAGAAPTGACAVGCDCATTSEAGCAALGGTYLGDGAACFAAPTLQEPGQLAGNDAVNDPADPVYLFSGEFFHSAVDLRIRGRGPDFAWGRKYRSRIGPNVGIGSGWDFSYDIRIFLLDDRPGEVTNLVFTDEQTSSWTPPADLGGPAALLRYCTLRSTDPSDFASGATTTFIEMDGADTLTQDPQVPPAGGVFYYLVSAKNKHGEGTLGTDSSGVPRQGLPCGAAGPDLLLLDGNTRRDVYDAQPNGTWAAREFFQVFTANPDGSYTLTFPDTSRWIFHGFDGSAHEGKIASMADRNGNALSFSYDPGGRLVTVTDALGRAVAVGYDASGFIATVTDFTGRQVRYAYYDGIEPGGAFGDLKSVTTPAVTGTPRGNDFPVGKTTTYTYSTGNVDERLNHNLLTITDGRGQTYLVNQYAPTANPGDVGFDRLVRQTWGDPGDLIDFVYTVQAPSAANGHAVIKATLNDRVGNVKEYSFDAGNRCVRIREHTGRANPDLPTDLDVGLNPPMNPLRPSDPPFFETRREWNADALQLRIVHPNLNEERFTYDSGNPSRRSQGNLLAHCRLPGPLGGDQPNICESSEYDPFIHHGTNFVTREIDALGNATLHGYDLHGNRTHTQHRLPTIVEDFEYNAFGQRTAQIFPDNGGGHRRRDELTYYAAGPQRGYLHEAIVDASGLGLTTSYEYDAVGNVVREVDPRGHDTLNTYNQLDQLVRSRSREVVDGSGIRYEKDNLYDANDNVVREDVLNLDEQGLPRPNGRLSTLFDRDILNNIVRVCAEAGSADLPDAVLDCGGIAPADVGEFVFTELEHDANRNVTLTRYGEAVGGGQPSNVLRRLHDERDLLFREVRAEGDPAQSTTQHDYDGDGNEIRQSQGLESNPRVWQQAYDGYDRRTVEVDPMGNRSEMHYDANSNLVSHRSEGELLDQTSSSAGNVRLAESAFFHDAMNRLVRVEAAFFDPATQAALPGGQQPGKSISIAEYSANSQVLRVTDDNLHERETAYDTANRTSVVTDAAGNRTTTSYDANSNVSATTELERSDLGGPDRTYVTTYSYDNLDRLTGETDPVGNSLTYAYDSRGNLMREVDARGAETRHEYDGLDRLLRTAHDMNGNGASASDPADIVTAQSWDDSSRLVTATDDNGNMTQYEFDALDRLTRTTSADGSQETTVYDVHDNTTSVTDQNGSASSGAYDRLDRLTTRTIAPAPGVSADTTSETYRYDGRSRLVRATDNDSLLVFTYDSLAHTTRETLFGRTTVRAHDGVGNLTSCTYPGGRVISTTYDVLDRKKTIADAGGTLATYAYVGPRRVERRDFRNGTRAEYQYDGIPPNSPGDFGERRIVRSKHSAIATSALVDDRVYVWDPMQNKTRRQDLRPGGPRLTHDHGYDAFQRLVSTTVSNPTPAVIRTTAYTLDGVGNRLAVAGAPDPGAYVLDPTVPAPADSQVNQYSSTPFDAREYDANGNLTRITPSGGPPTTLIYDWRNQMTDYFDGATGQHHHYAYDAIGRRIAKTLDVGGAGTEHRYFRDGLHVVEAQDPAGVTLASYVWGESTDEILNMLRGGSHYYYHADDLGSVMALTDAAGSVVERYDYLDYGVPEFRDASGNVILPVTESAVGNPFLFQGRRWDAESRWYCHRARYRDPRVGVWTTRDAIGAWGDALNLGKATAFVGNNPGARTDPLGLQSKKPADKKEAEKKEPAVKTLSDKFDDLLKAQKDYDEKVAAAGANRGDKAKEGARDTAEGVMNTAKKAFEDQLVQDDPEFAKLRTDAKALFDKMDTWLNNHDKKQRKATEAEISATIQAAKDKYENRDELPKSPEGVPVKYAAYKNAKELRAARKQTYQAVIKAIQKVIDHLDSASDKKHKAAKPPDPEKPKVETQGGKDK